MKKYINRITDTVERIILGRAKDKNLLAEYYNRSSREINWKRQSESAAAKEIGDWKRALMAATDPDNPRRGDLMRFYINMLYDNHLSCTIDNRILPVQCAPFKLTDKNGTANEDAHRLLEKPWYLDIVRLVCGYTFGGTKLIGMFDLNDKMELARVEEIPQSNFIPQKGIVVYEEWDTEGVSYKEGFYKDYYFQVGGDWELGMLNQLAVIVIAKKLGIGSWMNYIDKFGVPPIFAVTDRMDTTRRDELFEMLSMFQQNHFAVLQGGEKIEVPGNYTVDAHNTFRSLISDIANSEISKRILGSTGMTDEKSFVGSAEVGERLFKYRNQVDKLLFKFYFNEEIKPRLVKLSPVYAPLADLTFEYDESETLTMKEIIEAVQGLSPYYEFSAEELAKITGLPITKIKSLSGQVSDDSEDEKISARGGSPPPQKKKLKPESNIRISSPQAAAWDTVISNIARQLYRGELSPAELDKDCVLKTYADLNNTAAIAWGEEYYDHPIARRMRDNLIRFSGAKAYQMLNAFTEIPTKGISEEDFITAVRQQVGIYNGAWLDAERSFTANSANSARDWQQFIKDKDIYRNLRFRTMGDENVREEHRALDGVVRPVDDAYWNTHTPPLGFRCRCWLEQTNEPVTETAYLSLPEQFQNNPGSNGIVFNNATSYFSYPDKKTALTVRTNSERMKFHAPYNRTEKAGENRVYISDFADPADLQANLHAARMVAAGIGKDVYIRPHIEIDGYKNPEFAIGQQAVHGDLKNYQAILKGKPVPVENFIGRQLAKANKQGCKYVVLNFANEIIPDLETALTRKLVGELNGINLNITHVVVIRGEKVARISRNEIQKKNFTTFLQKLK